MLNQEAARRSPGMSEFLNVWEGTVNSLSGVFDRMPKYAWIMKQMLEPERTITFRVAWIDDAGISRTNRGYRVQYSSAMGPYEGGTTFNSSVSLSSMKAEAFDTTFTNALIPRSVGGAYGGADFNPYNKSETEIQRFCQSYMTEMSKYIGPDVDLPGLGSGVGAPEIGYLYGQYKRINQHCGQLGKGLLWGGSPVYQQAQGFGVAHFADCMLRDKGQSLEGKRCVITGSNYVALAVAEKLLDLGAIPISFTDDSGSIFEERGFDMGKLKTIQKIKQDRGARIGRYIIASTSAKFNDPPSVCDIPCDLIFPCQNSMPLTSADVTALAAGGCMGIIEGVNNAMLNEGISTAKKRGLMHGPCRATTVGASLMNGIAVTEEPLQLHAGETLDTRVRGVMEAVHDEVKSTAKEFNRRGDLHAGANIAAFMRVGDIMLMQGSV